MCRTGDQQVITYFKNEAAGEMLLCLQPAIELLEKYRHPCDEVYTNFVGEIVYEDRWQVVVRCG